MSRPPQINDRSGGNNPTAADQLLPLVYDELRKLAASRIARELPGQTLQATALVHEAWLRLAGTQQPPWQNQAHFFAAAAEAMRRILIDVARAKASLKRSTDLPPEQLHESQIEMAAPADEVLAVHDALDALAAHDATAAQVVKLRYFVGMTIPEVAQALDISPRSADRHWNFARAWLKGAIRKGPQPSDSLRENNPDPSADPNGPTRRSPAP